MKLFARPKNLAETMAPVITLNRLMGLHAFEYPRGQPRPMLSLIYLLFLYCLYYSGSMYLEDNYYSNVNLLKLEHLLYKPLETIVIYLIFVKLLLGWWYTKKFETCCRKIFEIDETLRQLGSAINYDKIYFIIIGVMIVWFVVHLSVCIMVFIEVRMQTDVYITIGTTVVYFYELAVNFIIIFEFNIFVRCLQMKFELINKLLHESLSALSTKKLKLGFFEMKDYAKIMNIERQICSIPMKILPYCRQKQLRREFRNRSQRHNFVMTEGQKHMYLLQIIKQVHLELCKVLKTICIIFGIQIACELGITIIFLTVSLYNLYIRYIGQQIMTYNLMQRTVIIILISVLDILKITFLSRVCKDAADEGNKTVEIIYSIYGCDIESYMQEEIQQFGIQILQSPVRFSAYGISLDNQVFTKMLEILTTYLVIMIQMFYKSLTYELWKIEHKSIVEK
ncbi:uncharacterized protein LOC114931933 [Nylanderia fulva]|uniref:uncharacterized protein LOC114931933 n=1 Tax=Nylanderia fulva TaxID=613905 RepID=UPI0010FB01BD|nr:uncharacterized protein LOC114931933 [Nylanderia fulva]